MVKTDQMNAENGNFIYRLMRIIFGYLVAVIASVAVFVSLAFVLMTITDGIALTFSPNEIEGMKIFAIIALPATVVLALPGFLVALRLANKFQKTSAGHSVLWGLANALVGFLIYELIILLYFPTAVFEYAPTYITIYFGGMVGGYVYWLLAIRDQG